MRLLYMLEYRLYSFLNHSSSTNYETDFSNHKTNNSGNKKRKIKEYNLRSNHTMQSYASKIQTSILHT
jgi:hypothetical protein